MAVRRSSTGTSTDTKKKKREFFFLGGRGGDRGFEMAIKQVVSDPNDVKR